MSSFCSGHLNIWLRRPISLLVFCGSGTTFCMGQSSALTSSLASILVTTSTQICRWQVSALLCSFYPKLLPRIPKVTSTPIHLCEVQGVQTSLHHPARYVNQRVSQLSDTEQPQAVHKATREDQSSIGLSSSRHAAHQRRQCQHLH